MTQRLPRRKVGRTGLEVTVLGLGGAPLGNLFEPIPDDRALATIEAAHAAGVGLFDTAPQYGHGVSEHRFGHVLRDKPLNSFVLSTKVGRMLRPRRPGEMNSGPFKKTLNFEIVHDYSYHAVIRSVEDSQQRLGLDRFDIALIHDVDMRHHGDAYDQRFEEAIGGACRALADLKAAGVVAAIGIGVNEIEPCIRFAQNVKLDCYMVAGRYTLLEQSGLASLLSLAETQGFSLFIAGPFNSGILATGAQSGAMHDYRCATPEVIDRVQQLAAICQRHDTPLGAAALQFPLAHPNVASVVTGAVRPEEIAQNVRWMTHPIPQALWGDLRNEGLLSDVVPTPDGAFA